MVRPKKHLGQHFLHNEGIARDITHSLSGVGYESIVEIGPGMGVLTKYLKDLQEDLFVVEIDRESVQFLKVNHDLPADHIIEGDFLKLPLSQLFNRQVAVIGNFPYNISTQIVFKVLKNRTLIPEVVGMFQKEVAERIVAKPGSKIYGILSVLTAAYYEREYIFTVEPHEFRPPPKVKSGVIRLQRKENPDLGADESLFQTVVKMAFNQRRKTLRNALKPLNLSPELAAESLFDKRAEQLELEDYIYITNRLSD